jgi:hypothetical protein
MEFDNELMDAPYYLLMVKRKIQEEELRLEITHTDGTFDVVNDNRIV